MITVTRADPYVRLAVQELNDGAYATLYAVGARPIPAYLHFPCRITLELDTDVVQDSSRGAAVRIPIPANLPNGLYTLTVYPRPTYPTDCQIMTIHALLETPVRSHITHRPTNPHAGDTIVECCEDTTGDSDG